MTGDWLGGRGAVATPSLSPLIYQTLNCSKEYGLFVGVKIIYHNCFIWLSKLVGGNYLWPFSCRHALPMQACGQIWSQRQLEHCKYTGGGGGLHVHPWLPTYHVSSKSCHTSKSRHPRNVAACFYQLIPINATLEISSHGKGSLLYTYAYAHYSLICMQRWKTSWEGLGTRLIRYILVVQVSAFFHSRESR